MPTEAVSDDGEREELVGEACDESMSQAEDAAPFFPGLDGASGEAEMEEWRAERRYLLGEGEGERAMDVSEADGGERDVSGR